MYKVFVKVFPVSIEFFHRRSPAAHFALVNSLRMDRADPELGSRAIASGNFL